MQTCETVEEIATQKRKVLDFRDFSNLDQSESADYLIASMDKMIALEATRAIKQQAIALLGLKPGDSVIEIGCGLGHDAETMGTIVGTQGSIVALDASALMVNEARRRSQQPQISYQVANGEGLNFPDNSFTAGYADRLLVSQKNIEKVFGELVRVVEPGGKICITDIDLGSIILYPLLMDLRKN